MCLYREIPQSFRVLLVQLRSCRQFGRPRFFAYRKQQKVHFLLSSGCAVSICTPGITVFSIFLSFKAIFCLIDPDYHLIPVTSTKLIPIKSKSRFD
jgi:hypothetical protein